MQDARRGRIVLQVQADRGGELLERVSQWIEQCNTAAGSPPCDVEGEPRSHIQRRTALGIRSPPLHEQEEHADPLGAGLPLQITDPPQPDRQPQVCVSYAWKEEHSSDPERAMKVQQFCDALAAAGRMVVRDTTHMKLGDRISEFMRRIGEADRIHVFLSDSYLKSPNCMYELLQIWERSHDAEDFRRRTRVFPMPGTDIGSPAARTKYAVYWKQQYDEMGDLVRKHLDIISTAEIDNWRRVQEFAQKVSEMLVEINDVLKTGDLSEYITHALRELGEAG
jgi:hypothetical protein